MPKRSARGLPVVSVALAAFAIGLAAIGRGEPPAARDAPEGAPPRPKLTERYFLATTCGRCHNANGNQGVTDFVRLDEFRTWKGLDKHSRAFEVLKDERSRRMGEALGWTVTGDARCLSCHAPAHEDKRIKDDPNADPKQKADLLAEGVSCASCHGPYQEWVGEHAILEQEEKWIAKTAAEKRDAYGMTDLRDPAVRAQVCASCHVGDADRGRVITHDMYAAGHPPLPGLETATFSQGEPPHWWASKEVPRFKKLPGPLREQYAVDQAATQHAKLVAVGGVVAFREAMDLFAATGKRVAGKGPPDFARFDCASCHHELKVSDDSWRQARGFAADPGRPPAADWPAALVSLGIVAADPAKAEARTNELAAKLKAFHAAVGKNPFGDPGASVEAAEGLSAWADALAKELGARKLDRDGALRMLKQIVAIDPPDHASARQLAWGFRNIYNELDPKPANHAQINAALNELTDKLGINLTPGNTPGTVVREVGARLDADDKFDPEAVGRLFERLAALLP